MKSVIRAGLVCAVVMFTWVAWVPTQALAARLTNGRWKLLDVDSIPPAPRRHATLVYDSDRQRAIMYGGDDAGQAPYADVWALDVGYDPHWVLLTPDSTPPAGRHGHAAIYVPGTPGRMIVQGGNTAAAPNEDASTETWELTMESSPSSNPVWALKSTTMIAGTEELVPRTHHSAVYFGNSMYIFGGNLLGSGAAELLQHDLASYSWTRICGEEFLPCKCGTAPGPVGRYWHTHIIDTFRQKMVIFGGWYDTFSPSDAWETDVSQCSGSGINWTSLGTAPSALNRVLHSAIYDPIEHRMIVFGGYRPSFDEPRGQIVSTVTAITLPVSGSNPWSTLTPGGTGPGNLGEHAAIYDPVNDRMIVFGGVNGSGVEQNDVWVLEFSTEPDAVNDLAAARINGNTARLTWTAPVGVPPLTSYDLRRSTTPITDDASFAAATPCAVSGPFVPQMQQDVSGLSSGVWFFALKSTSLIGTSQISNLTCVKLNPPYVECLGGEGMASPVLAANPALAITRARPGADGRTLELSLVVTRDGEALLDLLDVAGRRVASRRLNALTAGAHEVQVALDESVAPGFYMVRLRQDDQSAQRSLMIVR